MFPSLDQIVYISRQIYRGCEWIVDRVLPSQPESNQQESPSSRASRSTYQPPSPGARRPHRASDLLRNPFDVPTWRETLLALPPDSPCEAEESLRDAMGLAVFGGVIGPVAGTMGYMASRPLIQALHQYLETQYRVGNCQAEPVPAPPAPMMRLHRHVAPIQLSCQPTEEPVGVQASQAMTREDLVCE